MTGTGVSCICDVLEWCHALTTPTKPLPHPPRPYHTHQALTTPTKPIPRPPSPYHTHLTHITPTKPLPHPPSPYHTHQAIPHPPSPYHTHQAMPHPPSPYHTHQAHTPTFCVDCKVSIGCWGSCYEPVLAQVNLAFGKQSGWGRVKGWVPCPLEPLDTLASVVVCASSEKVVKRSVDPSKPLPFWDKVSQHYMLYEGGPEPCALCVCTLQMRAILHGPFKMTAEHAQLLLLSTRDPYNLTEYLDCQSTHLSVQYDTGR